MYWKLQGKYFDTDLFSHPSILVVPLLEPGDIMDWAMNGDKEYDIAVFALER